MRASIPPKTGEMRTSRSPLPTRAALVSPRNEDPFPGGVEATGPGGSLWLFFLFFFSSPNFAAFVRSGSILFGTGLEEGGAPPAPRRLAARVRW